MRYGTGTNNGILRHCDQLNGNDVSSRRQSVENQGAPPCTQLQVNNRETVGSSDRAPFSMHSCNPGDSTELQSPTVINTSSRWTKGKQLQSLSSDITGSTTGSNVVGVQPVNQSLTSNPEASSLIYSGDRCFYSRLGNILSGVRHKDRRAMVSQRSGASYQLVGTSRSFPGSSEFCSRETSYPCSADDGQSSGHLIHQQDGRNSLPKALQPCWNFGVGVFRDQ